MENLELDKIKQQNLDLKMKINFNGKDLYNILKKNKIILSSKKLYTEKDCEKILLKLNLKEEIKNFNENLTFSNLENKIKIFEKDIINKLVKENLISNIENIMLKNLKLDLKLMKDDFELLKYFFETFKVIDLKFYQIENKDYSVYYCQFLTDNNKYIGFELNSDNSYTNFMKEQISFSLFRELPEKLFSKNNLDEFVDYLINNTKEENMISRLEELIDDNKPLLEQKYDNIFYYFDSLFFEEAYNKNLFQKY